MLLVEMTESGGKRQICVCVCAGVSARELVHLCSWLGEVGFGGGVG